MKWQLWSSQIGAILRLEYKKYWRGQRWIAIYLLALAPSVLLLTAILFGAYPPRGRRLGVFIPTAIYATFFQVFWLRLAILFSCGAKKLPREACLIHRSRAPPNRTCGPRMCLPRPAQDYGAHPGGTSAPA